MNKVLLIQKYPEPIRPTVFEGEKDVLVQDGTLNIVQIMVVK